MKATGGFEYYLDGIRLKSYDEWEKKIKNINVTTEVKDLKIYAVTV